MIRDDAAEALAQAEFFDICDDEQRRMLAFAGEIRHFEPDAVLYQAGDVPQGAFVLISGTLKAKPEGPGAGKPYADFRAGQRGFRHGADPRQAPAGDHHRRHRLRDAVRAAHMPS